MTATITLADGTTYSKTWAKLPKNWKSALMRLPKYGTPLGGCTFTISK